jgi:hypothetical protein
MSFRVDVLGRLLREALSDRAEITELSVGGATDFLLVPRSPAAGPVCIHVVADVARISLGSGGSESQAWGKDGDEDLVVDQVRAIADGRATEWVYLYEEGGHVGVERAYVIVGDLVRTESGLNAVPKDVRGRQLPSWAPELA